MAIEILMPALSPTMTEGKLAKWLKKEGDNVTSGDVLAEIETDKATMEVEAVDEGVLQKILIQEGTEGVAVNTPIALLADEGGSAQPAKPGNGAHHNGVAPASASAASTAAASTSAAPTPMMEQPVQPQKVAAPQPKAPAPESAMGATHTATVREALRDAMAEEMRRDEKVFLLGEEVAEYQGAYKVSQNLLQEFGARRVIDTPITEQGFAGLAIGAAMTGLRPIVEFMTWNFAMQAMDQIINSAAKTNYMSGGQMGSPIVFRGPNGAAARVGAQHSQDYASWYAHIPGLKVVAPYTAADHKGLLKSAIRDPNPVIFLENEILYGASFDVPDDPDYLVPIGKARIARPGKDVTITAYSISVRHALAAADLLAKEGIDAEVIDLRSIRPLDIDTIIESVEKTNRIVSVEEGWAFSGIGCEIAAQVMERAFDYLDAPVARVAAKDVPLPYAANLEKLALPQPEDVVEAAKAVLYRR
jgi:pyruvate dehydrogenase E1 component beta subunit